MSYVLGEKSQAELVGVDDRLVLVANKAIVRTPVDFAVYDGMRTEEEQREYVAQGVSWTMNSKHLIGEALDLVPYVNGKLRWEWDPILKVMLVVQEICQEENIKIRWGGVWDRELGALSRDLEKEIMDYRYRRQSTGRKVHLDGPHIELL